MLQSLHIAGFFIPYHSVMKTTEMKFTDIGKVFQCKTALCPDAQKWILGQRTGPLSSLT